MMNAHEISSLVFNAADPRTWPEDQRLAVVKYLKNYRPKTDSERQTRSTWLDFFKPRLTCSSVNENCKAPPALVESHTRAKCYACGNAVCTGSACSRLIEYLSFGRQRICAGCQNEMRKTA